jgi:hypothetical protein
VQAALTLAASVTLVGLPGGDSLARGAAVAAIACSAASIGSGLLALARARLALERPALAGAGEGLLLSVRLHALLAARALG